MLLHVIDVIMVVVLLLVCDLLADVGRDMPGNDEDQKDE